MIGLEETVVQLIGKSEEQNSNMNIFTHYLPMIRNLVM